MGCKGSKTKRPNLTTNGDAAITPTNLAAVNTTTNAVASPVVPLPQKQAKQPLDTKSNEALSSTHHGKNGELGDGGTRTAPPKTTTTMPGEELDAEGNPLVLPEGEWVRTEGTPFYYSEKENLYYHPPSCQFYDPTNEMWYDPEKDEWYHDDETDG